MLPDGGADLLFSRACARSGVDAEVFGPKTRALVVADSEPHGEDRRAAAARRRGALARRARHTLTDRALPLDALWGRGRASWRRGSRRRANRAAQRALVEAALLARAPCGARARRRGRRRRGRDRCERRTRAGARLARALGASERRLERAFREHVGSRRSASRASSASGAPAAPSGRGASQLEAALAAGYHDQAHFHRDCRALAGVGPPRSALSDS